MAGTSGAGASGAGPASGKPKDLPTSRFKNDRFFTVAEVAELMRVSRMTVYRMVHDQTISSVRVGRSFRVPESAVNSYLESAYTEAG